MSRSKPAEPTAKLPVYVPGVRFAAEAVRVSGVVPDSGAVPVNGPIVSHELLLRAANGMPGYPGFVRVTVVVTDVPASAVIATDAGLIISNADNEKYTAPV